MPANTPDQQITLPVSGDPNNVPLSFADAVADIEPRLVKRYADDADRTARNGAPTNGEASFLTAPGRFDVRAAGVWMEALPLFVRKATETQVVNNSTTLVNDSHLLLPVQINGVYEVSGSLYVDSGTTGDFKVGWTGPAGATMPRWGLIGLDTGTAGAAGNLNAGVAATIGSTLSRGAPGIGTFVLIRITGLLVVAGTAGNLQLQWAQNAAEAVNTRIKTDSWLRLDRVG